MGYTESNFYCYKLASWFRFIHVAGRIVWNGFKGKREIANLTVYLLLGQYR